MGDHTYEKLRVEENARALFLLHAYLIKVDVKQAEKRLKMSKLRKLSRVAVALGGFLVFVGSIMVIISALAFYDVINVAIDSKQGTLFMWLLLIISLLNLASGILLVFNRR